jgi:choline kinase
MGTNRDSILKPDRVRTALLLAAGTGSRLCPLTDTSHKCLTEVNGVPILKQQIACLEHWGFEDLIVVVGHQGDQIREFLGSCVSDLKVSYIRNPRYRTTNNLYSLWLARKAIERSFLLLECDLFFKVSVLAGMLHPDRIALATRQPWMDGTTVTLDASGQVVAFQLGGGDTRNPLAYKTVNIHSLSLSTWRRMSRCLDAYVSSGRVNDYYEAVFRDMTVDGAFNARAVSFDDGRWYEVDTLADLSAAERLFANSRLAKRKIPKSQAQPAISRDAA